MNLELFDTNLYLGRPTRSVFQPAANVAELLAALDHSDIKQALVWHVAQRDGAPVSGNEMLNAALSSATPMEAQRLWGCWTILPPQTDEILCDGFFERMKRHRVVALRAFPDLHRYILTRLVFGRWLDEVTERRIPLFLSLEKGTSWPAAYQLLEQYPRLTCVLCDIGIWGVDRYTWPLLENYPNLYVETSLLALEDGGLEATVARFGADRLLFGSDFPERYPESVILQLLHADIADGDKQKIAAGNFKRLLSESEGVN